MRVSRKVPRTLMSIIRSYRFIGSSVLGERLIADALFTTMSMPPKRSTVAATAASHALLLAHIAHDRESLAASGVDLLGCREDGALKLGVRLSGLRQQRDVGAILGRTQRDREADPAAAAGDEHGGCQQASGSWGQPTELGRGRGPYSSAYALPPPSGAAARRARAPCSTACPPPASGDRPDSAHPLAHARAAAHPRARSRRGGHLQRGRRALPRRGHAGAVPVHPDTIDGKRVLRAANAVLSIGPGPIEVRGTRTGPRTMRAVQYVHREGKRVSRRVPGGAGTSSSK